MNRERILSAARALFAEKGFDGFSMRELAQQVGMSPSSVYNHFAGKEALYLAVMDAVAQQIRAEVYQRIEANTPQEALHELVTRKAIFMADHPDVARLVQWVLLDTSERTRTIMQTVWRPEIEWVLERMRQLVPDEHALILTHHLFGLLLHEFSGRFALSALPEAAQVSYEPDAVSTRVWSTVVCRIRELSQ